MEFGEQVGAGSARQKGQLSTGLEGLRGTWGWRGDGVPLSPGEVFGLSLPSSVQMMASTHLVYQPPWKALSLSTAECKAHQHMGV